MNSKLLSRLFILLTQKEKRQLFYLGLLMTLNALTEVLGIASVAPLIAVITDPNSVESSSILNTMYHTLPFKNVQQFAIFLGVFVLIMVTLNNLIALATNYCSLRYANNREASIGYTLLKTYLYQPYAFFLNRHSAELLRNVFNEVAYITSNVITRILMVLSRSVSAFAIILLIFYISPQTTIIIIAILGAAYGIIYWFMKKPLYNMGLSYVSLTEAKLRTITESIKLIKDIKMHGSEEMFMNKFQDIAREYSNVRTKSDIFALTPRYIIEIFAVAALVSAIAFFVLTTENSQDILPILGIYAFAGFRLMPALQQIFHSISKIQFSTRSLELIASEISEYKSIADQNHAKKIKEIHFDHSFGLKEASFAYQKGENILSDININIKTGQTIGLVGQSGEGKSTIIDLLVGLMPPQTGQLYVDNTTITEDDYESWRLNISYASQAPYLLDETIDMNVALDTNPNSWDQDRLKSSKEIAAVNFTVEDGSTVGENGQRLSGGQKQRIGIARAIYQDNPILILDEATSALDSKIEKDILESIKRLRKTLILISHRVETLKFCDQIYVVSKGKIVDYGTYTYLEKNSAHFEMLLRSES